jgi:protein-disulfide isomerase
VNITRRQFAIATGTLALTGILGGLAGPHWLTPAYAQDPSPAELMKPGPLGEMILGDDKAPVTIIEYASMTCPHCAAFHKTTYPVLKTKYIDTGKVRFIFREFPLDELAVAGSMLARCAAGDKAANPDKALALISVLFNAQDKWAVRDPIPALLQISKQAGFTQASFDACLKDQTLYNNILAVRERGSKDYKVESTPTLFVNGKTQKGGVSIEELDKLIAPLLKS